ncbi:hypothetical protein C0Q70_04094 [Pomacea canaliculata]|uniref:Uncharacterized protein n=1 Tax=Pomacea canaliculata TaxID=400727 RepID=A0A2T7PUM8_POMCA|nr:hypothetical protein C0Q70_04094 [Pomacea canaliculata]
MTALASSETIRSTQEVAACLQATEEDLKRCMNTVCAYGGRVSGKGNAKQKMLKQGSSPDTALGGIENTELSPRQSSIVFGFCNHPFQV